MMARIGLIQSPSLLDRLVSASLNSAAPVLWIAPLGRRNCMATQPLSGGCAPLRIEFPSAAALPSLVEKGGAEGGAGFKALSTCALAVGRRRRSVTTIYQGTACVASGECELTRTI
jgi:hypothetical protein